MPDCPVCAASSAQVLARVGEYLVYECPVCHLRFSNPMRNPGAQWYEQSSLYFERRETKSAVPMHLARSDWRYRSFFALNLNPEGRLLEVGCGSGLFMKLAAAQGYQVEGIDADPSAIHAARHLYGLENVRVLSAEELLAINPGDGLFDVICLFDVLEHLEEPLQVVRGLGQRLAAGGYLVCTVPDHQRWPKLFALDVDLPPHHLTLWTPQALQRCFENGGLEPWLIKPSPLLGETLLHQASLRWGALRRLDLLGKLLRGTGHYLVMPIVARLLSMVPQAGGFTLLGVARRAEGGQTYG